LVRYRPLACLSVFGALPASGLLERIWCATGLWPAWALFGALPASGLLERIWCATGLWPAWAYLVRYRPLACL